VSSILVSFYLSFAIRVGFAAPSLVREKFRFFFPLSLFFSFFFSTCSAEDAEEKVRTQNFGFWFWTCSKRNGCADM
jgi:hypothetical protein